MKLNRHIEAAPGKEVLSSLRGNRLDRERSDGPCDAEPNPVPAAHEPTPEELSPRLLALLACPFCGAGVNVAGDRASCRECGQSYEPQRSGQLNLRLRCSKTCATYFAIPPLDPSPAKERVWKIPHKLCPELDVDRIEIPALLTHGNRLTRPLLSHFPRIRRGVMLDLGCGYQDFREICAHTGMEYVGVDHEGPATLLADAHALPFRDNSFDFVISFAVLEHLRNPYVALGETLRVMKPEALFIGSVAFLEPFHLNSYFHTSPLGTCELLSASGFRIHHVEPNIQWQALRALSQMSLFPHMPRLLADLIVLPIHLLHRLWWMLGHAIERRPAASEQTRRITNSGGFRFVCSKPANAT
jgi:SAM-dependent methyltransferase